LVPTGAVWKYLDNGSDQATAWRLIGFNDAGWSNGPAQLGYGDGDERTVVGYGPNSGAKFITTYFRRAFNIADYSAFSVLNLRVLRDDGVVVYLNGTEVYRNNLPSGPVGFQTAASIGASGADESTYLPSPIDPGGLLNGTNVIAAEIHQNSGTSSDISFDFELTGVQSFLAPFIVTHPLSQAAGQGSVASLDVVAGGASPLRYQWRFFGTNLPGATNATLTFTSAQPSHSGPYAVVITNIAGATTSAVASVTVTTLDTDGDGMPDAWEQAHSLSWTVNDAALDLDGDGATNLAEFIAGTRPDDASSVLRIDILTPVIGRQEVVLGFNALSNRTYAVLQAASLPGPWTVVAAFPGVATNRFMQVTNAIPTSGARHFRLVTPAP
jgi:hypothetical protein